MPIDTEISYIPMDAINERTGEITYLEAKPISEAKGYTRFRENDLVWAKITPCMQNGKSAIVKGTLNGYACGSTEFYIIRPKESSIKVEYLHHLLRDKRILETAENYFGGSAGQQRVSIEFLKHLEIPILPLDLQQSIIDILEDSRGKMKSKLSSASLLLSNIDKQIALRIGFDFPKIEERKIFATKQTSFENRLDPHFYLPNFKSLIDNIRKTENAQLGDLVEFSKETWNQKDGFEKEFPYIEISEIDLASGKVNNISILPIEEAPSRAKMIVRTNDIIVSTTRPHRGAISLITNSLDGFIASTGFAVLRNLKSDIISKEYLYYILRTQICLQQMLQRSSGGSYPAITAEELKNIYIPIPSKEVQNEVVEEIKRYIEEAERLKNEANLEFEVAKKEIENLILN